jgi:modulator of FtsH protease
LARDLPHRVSAITGANRARVFGAAYRRGCKTRVNDRCNQLILATLNEGWDTFGQVVGGASGALVGLLFVAVSLNRVRIIKHTVLRASALQTLLVLVIPLLIAILLTTPRQRSWVLGSEFIVLGLITVVADIVSGHWKRKIETVRPTERARLVSSLSPILVNALLILTAGGLLAGGVNDGIYLVVPVVFFSFIGGVANAWLFLMTDLD